MSQIRPRAELMAFLPFSTTGSFQHITPLMDVGHLDEVSLPLSSGAAQRGRARDTGKARRRASPASLGGDETSVPVVTALADETMPPLHGSYISVIPSDGQMHGGVDGTAGKDGSLT